MKDTVELINPYPGLRPFHENDEDFFFGREQQIRTLLKDLEEQRFLAVMGVSGSGKSSLVKCGLLSAIHKGLMRGAGHSWRAAVFRPEHDPIGNLARSLASADALKDPEEEIEGLEAIIYESILRRGPKGIQEVTEVAKLSEHENLLIVVDQFEELFRFNRYEKVSDSGKYDSAEFVNLLLEAAKQRCYPVYVVLTMRSEFLGECTRFRGLAEAMNSGQFLIPRMSRSEMRLAIEGPCRICGVRVSLPLVHRLLNDMDDDPDQLPLLQHVLMRTWEFWEAEGRPYDPLDLCHYEAAGTLSAALSMHAEEAFAELKTEREQAIAAIVFKALTELDEDQRGIRRPASFGELLTLCGGGDIKALEHVINVFRKSGRSFLMPPADALLHQDTMIDLSHESLMRVWGRLIEWVETEGEAAAFFRRLSEQARLHAAGKTGLWRDPELGLGLQWLEVNAPDAKWAERYGGVFEQAISFLDQSKLALFQEAEAKEAKRKQELRRLRRFALFLILAALLLGTALFWALKMKVQADSNRELAEVNEKKAIKNKEEAILAYHEADSLRGVAEMATDSAEKAALEAELARISATRLASEKSVALALAESRRIDAESAARREKEAAFKADLARFSADSSAYVADSLRFETEQSLKEVKRLRLLAISRALAIMTPYIDSLELRPLLAIQAFKFHSDNGGASHSPELYNAFHAGNQVLKGKDYNVFDGHRSGVRACGIHPDGKRFFSAGSDGQVLEWELGTPGKGPKVLFNSRLLLKSLSVHPSGKSIAFCGGDNRVYVSDPDAPGLGVQMHDEHRASVYCLAYDPNGKYLVSGDVGGTLVIRGQGGSRQVNLGSGILTVAASKKGLLGVSTADGLIALFDPVGLVIQDTISNLFRKPATDLVFSPSGRYLAWGMRDGTVHWYDLEAGKLLYRFSGPRGEISGVDFSHDGRQLAASSLDGSVRIWNLRSPLDPAIRLKYHEEWVWGVSYSPVSRVLVAGDEGGILKQWPGDLSQFVEGFCDSLSRRLTEREWDTYVGGDIPYDPACR